MRHRILIDMAEAMNKPIPDPGDAGTLAPTRWGVVPFVSATAETRTLSNPAFAGQLLYLYMKTDNGDITLTVTDGYNMDGDTSFTFDDAGDSLLLMAVEVGADLRWRVVGGSFSTATALTLLSGPGAAPGTPDYAIAAITNSTPYGTTTADEFETVISVVLNLQSRVAALETLV